MKYIYIIPQEFLNKYNLKDKAHNGYIFAQVTKGVYVLPKSGLIAHDTLVQNVKPYRYHLPIKIPVIWTHNSCPINFILVVDDFGVKYSGNKHALKAALENKYKVTTDWERKLCIGIALKWDHKKGTIQL